jgi:hypothetical protein
MLGFGSTRCQQRALSLDRHQTSLVSTRKPVSILLAIRVIITLGSESPQSSVRQLPKAGMSASISLFIEFGRCFTIIAIIPKLPQSKPNNHATPSG